MIDHCRACGEPIAAPFVITSVDAKTATLTRAEAPCPKCGEVHPLTRKAGRPAAKPKRTATR